MTLGGPVKTQTGTDLRDLQAVCQALKMRRLSLYRCPLDIAVAHRIAQCILPLAEYTRCEQCPRPGYVFLLSSRYQCKIYFSVKNAVEVDRWLTTGQHANAQRSVVYV